jgi:hypothetical protein
MADLASSEGRKWCHVGEKEVNGRGFVIKTPATAVARMEPKA